MIGMVLSTLNHRAVPFLDFLILGDVFVSVEKNNI